LSQFRVIRSRLDRFSFLFLRKICIFLCVEALVAYFSYQLRRLFLETSQAWQDVMLIATASMPSPPPPYSPGQNPNVSQSLSTSNTSSPQMSASTFPHPPPPPPPSSNPSSARPISGYHSRPGSMVIPSSATSITSNPQFPPPPPRNGTGRSVSRDKLASKFSLSSFRNRNNDHSPGPSNIDSLRISTSDAIQRAPASPGLVAQRAASKYVLA
jgi:hypothetical protein